ncbi:MAG TPA: hypothetical protein VFK71_08260 [Gaiellaceae bacterium]|nr:hypothetical protein [Gaiellaceae bacterium]
MKVTTRRAAAPSYYSFKTLDTGEPQGFVINEETQRDVGFGESLRQALAARSLMGCTSTMDAAAQMMRGIAVTVVVVLWFIGFALLSLISLKSRPRR